MPKTVAFAVTPCLLGFGPLAGAQQQPETTGATKPTPEEAMKYADSCRSMDDATAIASRIPLVH